MKRDKGYIWKGKETRKGGKVRNDNKKVLFQRQEK